MPVMRPWATSVKRAASTSPSTMNRDSVSSASSARYRSSQAVASNRPCARSRCGNARPVLRGGDNERGVTGQDRIGAIRRNRVEERGISLIELDEVFSCRHGATACVSRVRCRAAGASHPLCARPPGGWKSMPANPIPNVFSGELHRARLPPHGPHAPVPGTIAAGLVVADAT